MNKILANCISLGIGLGAIGVAFPAQAFTIQPTNIIWDYSPAATNTSSVPDGFLVNASSGQNFAETVSFPDPATITGMSIYSGVNVVSVGDGVTIRVWTDSAGVPGTLIHNFTETISVIDTAGVGDWLFVNNLFANFTNSINLAANTPYWIGMSGFGVTIETNIGEVETIGLASLNTNPGDGAMAQFSGTTLVTGFQPVGDMAFRLYGTTQSQPDSEPGTTPTNPLLPTPNPNNPDGFTFPGVPVGDNGLGIINPIFFDPIVSVGYDYAVTGGPLFASVLIPNPLPQGDSNFILELPGFGNYPLVAGTTFNLLGVNPLGFSDFRISDIDPTEMLDPTNPTAFVTGLTFTAAGTVTVTQN
ncbi:MAG: hypothetical protein PX634_08955, partial [Microcystis sp. M53600_WE12]|nr:hypothetical protein [Microcystis sp. M53600_WE12]